MWRNRIQLPSNQKLQGETCQPSPHATSQKANIQGPRSQGTLGCMDMLADMEERGNKITQDTLSALKSRRTPPLGFWKSFQRKHPGVPFTGWLLISGSTDNRIYCSRCPDVILTKSDTTSHQGGGTHHRIEWTRPLDFAQEVGLPETSRYLLPNWRVTSLSESIHLENSRVSASLFFSTKS